MNMIPRILLAGACALSLGSAAHAAPHATSSAAQALLDKAVTEMNTVGADKAFAEFDRASGPFNTGELYVFVFGMDGQYEATGANPKLIGTDAIDLADAEGKPIVREMIALAKGPGHGTVTYVWLNRADNRVEPKWSLVQRVGDHIVGVGYYPN